MFMISATPEDPVKDTEEDDPEYNYLEEEEQEYDKEDFRDDRAVKVSSKIYAVFTEQPKYLQSSHF